MAHNLRKDQKTGKTNFAAVGELAWHKLGTYVKEAMTADQVIELAGLGYTVEKRPLSYPGYKFSDCPEAPIEVPDMFATVRTDTDEYLGIVSDKYHIVQNSTAFDFFDSIVDRGEAIFQTAGVLGKGERIFISAILPEDFEVMGEQIKNYLLLTTGHDGKSTTQIGFTPTRVVCNNTLTAALKAGLKNKVSILHFKNAESKIAAASKVMGIASKYFHEVNEVFNSMAKVKITDAKLREYIEQVMKPAKETINPETLKAEFSTRFINQVDEIFTFAKDHPTQKSKAARGTVWGAYNSISGYYSYLKDYKSQEEKLFDELTLWDTNITGNPRKILTQRDGSLTIFDKKLYENFLKKANGK